MILAFLMWVQSAITLLPIAGAASDPGRCAWEHSPAAVQAEFLEAYGRGMASGTALLQAHDAELKTALDRCTPPGDQAAPDALRQGLIGSAAIRAGAADVLAKTGGPTRERLEQVWSEAPEAARTCTRANAGRIFGQTLACPDKSAPLALTTAVGIDLRTDVARGSQVLFFMNATAQTEWELGLLKAYEHLCAGASGCPKPH